MNVEHIQNEDQPFLDCLRVKLLDLGLFLIRIQPANLLKAVTSFIRVKEQFPAKLTLNSFDLVVRKHSDWHRGLQNITSILDIWRMFNVYEAIIVAKVSEIASALLVDVLKNVGE